MREVGGDGNGVGLIALHNLPHSHQLILKCRHKQHTLWSGCLLDDAGVTADDRKTIIDVCGCCMSDLWKADPDRPPPLALANGMWIGPVPPQLQSLTLPEQLLIGHLYPHTYIFKLFPKNVHASINADALQRGLRGNVSTYDLDLQGAVSRSNIDSQNNLPKAP
jgi:hypothetical protein